MIPLSPEVARTIRSSCKPLLERQEQFQGDFHACLLELMPDVPVMREPAGAQISRWLAECVLWAVYAEEPLPMIGATLQGIGLDAHRLGFPRSGYQAVGHALLRTMRGVHSLDWSGALSSSWIGYHGWLCEYWLSGADIGMYEAQTRPIEQIPEHAGPDADPSGASTDVDDDEDDEDGLSYGEIMVSMTLGSNRGGGRREERRPSGQHH